MYVARYEILNSYGGFPILKYTLSVVSFCRFFLCLFSFLRYLFDIVPTNNTCWLLFKICKNSRKKEVHKCFNYLQTVVWSAVSTFHRYRKCLAWDWRSRPFCGSDKYSWTKRRASYLAGHRYLNVLLYLHNVQEKKYCMLFRVIQPLILVTYIHN